MNTTSTFSMRRLFTTTIFVGLFSFLGFSQLTVTKTYIPAGSVSVDGCGTYCSSLPGLTFSAADFAAGACTVTDVNVNIVWAKTDGTCAAPLTGNSFHNETNFRIDGPSGNEILVAPGTYTGTATMSLVSTTFNQGSPVVGGATPFSGTFGPNNGNLNNFNGTTPFGTWTLRAGDTAGGDPLCISSYSVTITVATGGVDPDVPTALVATPSTFCSGLTSNLTWTGALNDATQWSIYTGSCGGTLVGTSTTNSFTTPALAANTTFYIRGEDGPGGCIDESIGLCGQVGVTVNALPTATFTAPADLCIDAGVQAGLGGGTPSGAGGVYSGPGVTDDGNGTTYSFNPAAAGVGIHTITYTFTDGNGCVGSANDNVEVFALPTVTFTAPGDVCPGSVVLASQGGGLPSGGVYSGPGVTDDGNGTTYSFDPVAAGLGLHTITYTFTDGNGCQGSANDNIEVVDAIVPSSVCQDITVFLDGTGAASIVAADLDGGSTDNCGAVSFTASTTAFTCADLGPNNVTLTVDDGNGNSSNCIGVVTILDTISPTITCATPAASYDVDAGTCAFAVVNTDLDPAFADNCTGSTVVNSITGTNTLNGASFGLGTTNVVWQVTDGSGNTATCNYNVVVVDNEAPVALCQDITIQLDASGNATIVPAQIDNGSSDNCGIGGISVSPNTFTCAEVGANTVTLTVLDNAGNSATCTSTVTVEDNVVPNAICQDITVQLDAAGNAVILPSEIDGGSNDNCSPVALSFTALNAVGFTGPFVPGNWTFNANGGDGTFVFGGTTNVTLTGTDAGAAAETELCITIPEDGNLAFDWDYSTVDGPQFDPFYYSLDGVQTELTDPAGANTQNGSVSIPVISGQQFCFDQGSVDGIVGAGVTISSMFVFDGNGSQLTLDCANIGANTVPLIVTDPSGNVSTCDAIVTVEDNVAPVALCSDITVTLDAAGNATIVAADIDGGSTDNCGIASLAASITAFDCSMVGPNTVTLTVTDNDGNVATCDAIVTVEDTENPAITCPADVVVNNDPGVCGTMVTYAAPTATDNCGSITSSELLLNGSFESGNLTNWVAINNPSPFLAWQVQPSFSYFNTVTPTDGTFCAGNGFDGNAGTAELYQQFTLPATGTSIFSWDDNLQYSVGGAPRTYEVRIADATGTTLATLLSVSASGNSTPNTWISHSEDISAFNGQTIRIVFWQNIPANYTGPGRFAVDNVSVLNNTSTINLAQTDATGLTTGDVFPIGTTTIEYTATDDSGNTDVCSFDVTVTDNEAPAATCQPITVQLDATGNATIVAADVDGGSTDNCGIASTSIDISSFTCANVGPNNVTLTVNDVNGNSSTCVAVVTVEDNVLPTAICQDITVVLDAAGSYTMLDAEIDNGSNDACGIASISASQTAFGCGDVGVVPVTLTVTDNNGNVSTCVANVTVEDNEAPIAACVAGGTQFFLDANGDLTMTGAMMDAGSSDACGIASLTASPSSFTCADIGFQIVTLTVTDVNGNVSTCVSNIEIVDNIAPVITCPADITVNAIVDNCGRTVTYNFDVVDACATITQTDGTGFTSGNLFPVGTTVQSYEVTDQTGTYTCTFNVTVNDVQNPIITNCPSNIVVSTDLGSCDAGVNWTEPIASDNCPAVSFTSTHSPGDVFALGTTTVTYTATDASGNAVTCSFTVTVNDNEAPLITDCTPDITVSNDAFNCDAVVTFAAPVYTENCTMGTEVATIASGSAFPVGTTPVTWTITDAAGNASTCTFNVIVEDTELPLAVCNDITVQLDPTGNVAITPADIDGGLSDDNCGIASQTLDISSFDCSNVGANTVTMTVTDIHGNVSTCTSTVTVEDNVLPNALCAPITVQLDATGNVSITGADIDAGSNDNCGIASLVASPNTFTCAEVGANVVTLTVTDVNGNTQTCVTTVNVQDNVAPVASCQDITVQ